MKGFADNLKRLRKERGMSQNQLANVSCISIKTIQNYEQNRGGSAPTLHNLMLLADILDVTPYYLYFGGKNEMITNSMYMQALLSELKQLPVDAIKEIHDTEAIAISLPKFTLSDSAINELAEKWNEGVQFPKRGFYKSYIEATILRYAQNRQVMKRKYLSN